MDKSNDTLKPILDALKAIEGKLENLQNQEQRDFDLTKLISSVSSLGFSILGIIYILGFLVVNIHLSQYGAYDLSLIQSQYLVAGILLVAMLAVTLLSEVLFTFQKHLLKVRVWFWRTSILLTSVPTVIALLLIIISERSWSNLLIAFMPFAVLLLGIHIVSIFRHGWLWYRPFFKKPTVLIRAVRSSLALSGLLVLFLLTIFSFLYLFSVMAYPLIKTEFGGGSPRLVQFYGSSKEFRDLQAYGIPLTNRVYATTVLSHSIVSPTFTIPLYLLGETLTSYIVTDKQLKSQLSKLLSEQPSAVSFQIRKEGVAGVLYISEP